MRRMENFNNQILNLNGQLNNPSKAKFETLGRFQISTNLDKITEFTLN